MIILLAVLCSLILITLCVIAIFSVLTHNRISRLLVINGAYQAEEYRQAVGEQKTRKPPMKAVKQVLRGRSVNKTEELIDLADMSFEDGIKAIEEMTSNETN